MKMVQTKNPRTGKYIKIDTQKGCIASHKRTKGPYKNVLIVETCRCSSVAEHLSCKQGVEGSSPSTGS